MSPDRYAALLFQARNNGHTPGSLKTADRPPNPGKDYVHGGLVQITLGELREFLETYPPPTPPSEEAIT